MKSLTIAIVGAVCLSSTALIADTGMCKLTIRTFRKEAATKLEIAEIETGTRAECQQEAESRRINSDPDVKQVQTSFSWKKKTSPTN